MNLKQTVSLLALILTVFAGNAFSVCGVYFKTVKLQYLSTPVGVAAYQDIDLDGKTDLIGLSSSNTSTPGPNSLVFYKRTATGFDAAPVISSLGSSFTSYGISLGDVNGDGKVDLVNVNATTPSSTTLYLGNGAGGFTASVLSVIGDDSERIVSLADLNGDNKADIVSTSNGGVKYRLVQADGSFGSAVTVGAGYTDTATADFNGDGKTDILLWEVSGTGNFKPLLNMGNAIFNSGSTVMFGNQFTYPKVVTDLNNDGKPDILTNIYVDPFDNHFRIYSVFINNGSGGFTKTSATIDLGGESNTDYLPSAADLDNDGDKDIIFAGKHNYFVGSNNGSGAFTIQKYSPPATRGIIEDTDADGKADNISFDGSVLTPFATFAKFKKNVCDPVGQNDIIDFNRDGDTDLAYWRASDGRWTSRNLDGSETNFFWGAGSLGDIPVPQDYDGDGQTDYAVFRASTGVWYVYRSSDAQVFIMQFGSSGDKPVAADFDGDDKADRAVYRPSTGVWYVWQSATNSMYAAAFGLNGDVPLPMDYDGDNKADLAVFRPSSGVWYIFKSGDSSYFISPFGVGTDRPVPTDYDNDGIADIAVFRDGVWYILRVRDSAVFVRQYGSAGDIPIPLFRTAFLGTNFTIFRPSNNFVFDQGETSISMPGFNGNRIVSYILPIE